MNLREANCDHFQVQHSQKADGLTNLSDLFPVSEHVQLSLGSSLGVENVGVLCLLQGLLADPSGSQELLVRHAERLSYHHRYMPGLDRGGEREHN